MITSSFIVMDFWVFLTGGQGRFAFALPPVLRRFRTPLRRFCQSLLVNGLAGFSRPRKSFSSRFGMWGSGSWRGSAEFMIADYYRFVMVFLSAGKFVFRTATTC